MDISDILLELGTPDDGQTLDLYDDSRHHDTRFDGQADYHALTRTWVNERSTEQLLRFYSHFFSHFFPIQMKERKRLPSSNYKININVHMQLFI